MAKNDDLSIFDELNSRLDDLFADDDDDLSFEDSEIAEDNEIATASVESEIPVVVDSVNTKNVQSPASDKAHNFVDSEKPLHQLKAIVLEMDWEISDENLNRYLDEISSLLDFYKEDRPIYLFFKLHLTIGKYMLAKKARAHPAALKFLYNVFNSLEKALQSNLPLLEKNKLILQEVQNFKDLKIKLFSDLYKDKDKDKNDHNKNCIVNELDTLDNNSLDNHQEDPGTFDISTFPDEIQRGINEYIEKSISEKIDAIKKELSDS